MNRETIKSLYILCGELNQQLRVQIALDNLEQVATGAVNPQKSYNEDLVQRADEFLENIRDEVDLFDEL
jgi:hypothetical protein